MCKFVKNVFKGTLHFTNNLGSKDILTPLNNEFRLKKLYSTSFMLKIHQNFRKKSANISF